MDSTLTDNSDIYVQSKDLTWKSGSWKRLNPQLKGASTAEKTTEKEGIKSRAGIVGGHKSWFHTCIYQYIF